MLSARYKLSPNEIPLVARKGSRHSGKLFDLKVIQDKSLVDPKIAISVSKKVARKAVTRNKMKRLLREALRELIKKNQLPPAKYLLINKSADVSENTPADLAKQILTQLG